MKTEGRRESKNVQNRLASTPISKDAAQASDNMKPINYAIEDFMRDVGLRTNVTPPEPDSPLNTAREAAFAAFHRSVVDSRTMKGKVFTEPGFAASAEDVIGPLVKDLMGQLGLGAHPEMAQEAGTKQGSQGTKKSSAKSNE